MLSYVRSFGLRRSAAWGTTLILLALAAAPAAGEPLRSPAAADLSRVDQDYALQGEFAGNVPTADQKDRVIALQVRATGHGRFHALQFDGGLPGEVQKPNRPVVLVGKRSEQFLVLSGGPWGVFVHPDHCLLVDATGQSVGQLHRVYRESPTLGVGAPKPATVLFNGSSTDLLANARLTDNGLLMEGTNMIPMFQDFDLHLEFMLPYMPETSGQNRANSGVYLLSRYEVQILDSFAMSTTFNGCGSLYRYHKPDLNMCLPPLVWQTYDISFTAPRWAADGKKLKNAKVTVWLNGVKVHDKLELTDKTGAGAPEEVVLLPIKLQDHGTPVRFRNIWLVDRGADGWVKFPVLATEEEKATARASIGATCAQSVPKAEPASEQQPPQQPTAEQPAPQEPAPQQPAPEQPAPQQPAPEQPASEQPVPQQPAEAPAMPQPAAEQPPAEQPQPQPAEAPATNESSEKPAAEQPAGDAAPKEEPAKDAAPQQPPAEGEKAPEK
jgi:hypothetical protein